MTMRPTGSIGKLGFQQGVPFLAAKESLQQPVGQE
jgi:hypothetical protein